MNITRTDEFLEIDGTKSTIHGRINQDYRFARRRRIVAEPFALRKPRRWIVRLDLAARPPRNLNSSSLGS